MSCHQRAVALACKLADLAARCSPRFGRPLPPPVVRTPRASTPTPSPAAAARRRKRRTGSIASRPATAPRRIAAAAGAEPARDRRRQSGVATGAQGLGAYRPAHLRRHRIGAHASRAAAAERALDLGRRLAGHGQLRRNRREHRAQIRRAGIRDHGDQRLPRRRLAAARPARGHSALRVGQRKPCAGAAAPRSRRAPPRTCISSSPAKA